MKKLFRIPFLLSLTLLLSFVSCNRNSPDVAPQPSKATVDIEDLAAKWTTRTESPEALQAVVEAYKSLTPAQMEQFIRADARHRVTVLGEDQEAADQYVETFVAMNKAAEATFKVGYNRVTPDQYAQLEKKSELGGSLHKLVEAFNKADLKRNPLNVNAAAGGRTAAPCYAPRSNVHYNCATWYRDYFNSTTTLRNYNSQALQKCAADWGFANKIGQSDCDRYFYFDNLPMNGIDPNKEWRHLYGYTPATYELAGWTTWPIQNNGYLQNGWYTKSVLIGATRVIAAGGGQIVANNLILLNIRIL